MGAERADRALLQTFDRGFGDGDRCRPAGNHEVSEEGHEGRTKDDGNAGRSSRPIIGGGIVRASRRSDRCSLGSTNRLLRTSAPSSRSQWSATQRSRSVIRASWAPNALTGPCYRPSIGDSAMATAVDPPETTKCLKKDTKAEQRTMGMRVALRGRSSAV